MDHTTPPGRVIAVLDACHSGAAGGVHRRPAHAADDLVRDLISEEYGVIVMSSSLGREYSLESQRVKQGYFTLALVEGLSGKADNNQDGLIFLNELDGYTARRVRLLSDGLQHPTTARPPGVRSFLLATAPGVAGPAQTVNGIEGLTAFDRGTELLMQRRHREALPFFDKAIALNVKLTSLYHQRGLVYISMGRWEDALKDADHALQLHPDFASAHALRGEAIDRMNRSREARAPYDEAIRLQAATAGFRVDRGRCLYKLREYEQAIEDFTVAVGIEPELVAAYEWRGLCRNNRGDLTGALADGNAAVELNPRSAMGHGIRALVYYSKQKNDLWPKELDQAITLDPGVGRSIERSMFPNGRPKN